MVPNVSNNSVEATWSDFLRDPNSVTDQLDRVDVVLHRSDAEDLHLSSEARHQAETEMFGLLARLLVVLVKDDVFRAALSGVGVLPWQQFLYADDRERFIAQFLETAVASVDLGTFAPLAQLIREWRTTALIYADPRRAEALMRVLGGKDAPARRRLAARSPKPGAS